MGIGNTKGEQATVHFGCLGRSLAAFVDLALTLNIAILLYAISPEPHSLLQREDGFILFVPLNWIVVGIAYTRVLRRVGDGLTVGQLLVRAVSSAPRSAIAASAVGLLFAAFSGGLGLGWALLLGAGVAFAYADIPRARSILNRRPDLGRAGSPSGFFRWLSWELVDLPGEGGDAPKDDLLTRILCASLDGRLQLVGIVSALVIVAGRSALVSATDRNLLQVAGVLIGAAAIARLPARARRAGAEVRRRSTVLARVAVSGAVLLFAFGTVFSSLLAVIVGLLAAALAFEALHGIGRELVGGQLPLRAEQDLASEQTR